MESTQELQLIKDSIDSAISQQKDQLSNFDRIILPFSIISVISFIGTIGLQVFFNKLLLWVPTSFILWIGFIIWTTFAQVIKAYKLNAEKILKQYNKISDKNKNIGINSYIKRELPLIYAASTIYVISALILVLLKAGIIESTIGVSIWFPFTVDILLVILLFSGITIYRHFSINNTNKMAEVIKDKEKLTKNVKKHLARFFLFVFGGTLAVLFVFIGIPIWALTSTWIFYTTDINAYVVIIVLLLQITSFLILSSMFTYYSARAELSNNITHLSQLRLRIDQILISDSISAESVKEITKRFYQVIKYRFIQDRFLGFIPIYIPVLNETYVKAN